ncbi:MAG: DUF6402 family protein [Actinomycetota bacterium]
MGLTDITKIPVIMRAKGWSKGADLLENWFSRAAYTRKTGGPMANELSSAYNIGDLNAWLLKKAEGKQVWDKIFNDQLWRSNDSSRGDAVKRLGTLLTAEGILKEGIKDQPFGFKSYTAVDYERNKKALNASSFKTGITTELNETVAALGSFNLKLALNGKVSHTPGYVWKNNYTVKPESIDVWLWDLFDFEDGPNDLTSQPLGCWDESDNSVAKIAITGGKVCVNNSTFRDYRIKNNLGGDFYICSDVLRHKFTQAVNLEPFEISSQ